MLHILDVALNDTNLQARIRDLLGPGDTLLLTGASLAWPDTHPLLACCPHWRLDDALNDDALAALVLDHGPILSHFSAEGALRHD